MSNKGTTQLISNTWTGSETVNFELPPGTWTITVTVYAEAADGTKEAISRGSLEQFTLSAGGIDNVMVKVARLEEVTGQETLVYGGLKLIDIDLNTLETAALTLQNAVSSACCYRVRR